MGLGVVKEKAQVFRDLGEVDDRGTRYGGWLSGWPRWIDTTKLMTSYKERRAGGGLPRRSARKRGLRCQERVVDEARAADLHGQRGHGGTVQPIYRFERLGVAHLDIVDGHGHGGRGRNAPPDPVHHPGRAPFAAGA